jgi:hypothetical protein
MAQLKNTISLSDTTQIGVPFVSPSFWKPTPKRWRILGDAIMGLGTVLTVVGGVVKNPVIVIASAVCGWLGKVITNSVSEK